MFLTYILFFLIQNYFNSIGEYIKIRADKFYKISNYQKNPCCCVLIRPNATTYRYYSNPKPLIWIEKG